MFGSDIQKDLFGALGAENSIINPSELLAGQAASDTASAQNELSALRLKIIGWDDGTPSEIMDMVEQIDSLSSDLDSAMGGVNTLNNHTGDMSSNVHSVMAQVDTATKVVAEAGTGDSGPCVDFLTAMGSLAGGAEDLLNDALSALGDVMGGMDGIIDLPSLDLIRDALDTIEGYMTDLLSFSEDMFNLVANEIRVLGEMAATLEQYVLSSQLLSWKNDPCTAAVVQNIASDEVKGLLEL